MVVEEGVCCFPAYLEPGFFGEVFGLVAPVVSKDASNEVLVLGEVSLAGLHPVVLLSVIVGPRFHRSPFFVISIVADCLC